MTNASYICVVGAANVDVIGIPDGEFNAGDSNPGTVMVSPGGVGRNIAAIISKLSYPVKLITVLGEDAYAQIIKEACMDACVDITYTITVKNARTSAYLCVNDQNGDARAAVSDMRLCDALTPHVLQDRLDVMNAAKLLILDANLPMQSIGFIALHVKTPIFFDPVSRPKALKAREWLNRFTLLKPNRMEAESLLNRTLRTREDEAAAARDLCLAGVSNVLLSLGSEGAYYDNGLHAGRLMCFPGTVRNTNGCGDAFSAAAAVGFAMGEGIETLTKMGLAAAGICAESDKTMPDDLCMGQLKERMERKQDV